MKTHKIYVWGFEEDELLAWPNDLQPIPISEWPVAGPLLVHVRAAQAFLTKALLHPLPDGRLPDAMLYLPNHVPMPEGSWGYFDATVQEDAWQDLRILTECPEQFRMSDMAEELPISFFDGLVQPVDRLPAAEIPLPRDVRAHLAACDGCRESFDRAVEVRLRWRRQLRCPAVNQLADLVRGITDDQLEQHLAHCRFCQAEVAVLRLELLPRQQSVIPWLSLTLSDPKALPNGLSEVHTGLWQVGLEIAKLLALLLNGAQHAGLQPDPVPVRQTRSIGGGARVRRVAARSHPVGSAELAQQIVQLQTEAGLVLTRPRRDLTLHWEAETAMICLCNLHGDDATAIDTFRVEIQKATTTLWAGDSTEARLCIPLSALVTALEQGADRLLIQAPP